MAKKTITTVTEGDEEPEKSAPEEYEADILRALTEIEGVDDIRWQVWRRSGTDPGYVRTYTTAELSIDRIAEECGPGRYQVKGIRSDGTYKKSATINIAKSEKPDIAGLLQRQQAAPPNNDQALLLAMINSNSQIVAAALARPPEAKREIPWAAIATSVPAALTALKDFFANKADPMKQMVDAITLTEKLRGKGEDSSSGTSWQDLLRDGVKSLPSVLQSLRPQSNSQLINSHPVNSQFNPITPEAILPPAHVEQTNGDDMNLKLIGWLRSQLERLIDSAARGRNPELYAELLIEELPPELPENDVLILLQRDDWFAMLSMFDSRVNAYVEWFSELRTIVIETLNPDAENDSGTQSDRHDDRELQKESSGNLRNPLTD